jgi:hypothetical protein
MSDLQAYISDRKKRDPEFAKGYDEGFRSFKIGVLLKQAREEAGLTQDQLAKQLNTKKKQPSHESRIEPKIYGFLLWRSMPRHLEKSSELNS